MVRKSGLALKGLQWFFTAIEFLAAAVILGLFCYFLATLKDHHLHIDTYIRAVTGIAGAACVFTLCGLVLLWCVGGVAIFALVALVLDVAFAGAFVYVAYVTRGGSGSCKGYVRTPFGSGFTNTQNKITAPDGGVTLLPSLSQACKLEKAAFAVAIIAIFFFLISAFIEVLLMKNHKKDKRYGPGPDNGYTSGATTKRRFWQRKPKNVHKDNPNALPMHATPADVRTSYAPTESTAVGNESVTYNKYGGNAPVSDGYAAPMGTHTTAGHTTAPYPHQPGVQPMPLAQQYNGHHTATNY